MRRLCMVLLAGAGLLVLLAVGQEPGSQPPQRKVNVIRTHDGGVTEVLQSIDVPPKAGAPFTLTLETEWVKQLYDGGTTTFVNKRRIARDATGRVYQERCALVPKNQDRGPSIRSMIQIFDPLEHARYDCFLLEETKTCELLSYTRSTSNIYKPMSPATGRPTG